MDQKSVHLVVNGKAHEVSIEPSEKLSDTLRHTLGLTGTKVGCGEGRCGICTVLMDGKPIRSCITPTAKADGKQILTIEGLRALRPERHPSPAHAPGHRGDPVPLQGAEKMEMLHPLQEAFASHGAVQCGFCTPGQIMQAYALLQNNPDPTFDEIREALDGVLCRCGSYQAICEAVQAAALCLRTGEPIPHRKVSLGGDAGLKHVGHSALRPDAVAKTMGSAKFTDDLHFEGMLYARVLRAGVPSAILLGLDVSEAQALPGVVSVLTAEALPAARFHGLYHQDWPVLVGLGERIRYMGDAIALVAAESQAIADKAVSLIQMTLEERPVVADPLQAAEPQAEQLHQQGNLLKHIHVHKGSLEEGFRAAEHTLRRVYHTPATDHLFMEPECSIAVPQPDGRMDIYCGSQIPFADRQQVAAALGVPEDQVRVRGQRAGGAFGGKEDIAGQVHAALLAQDSGRPVKLLFTRRESLLVHPKRHATQIEVKLGALRNGSLTVAQTELHGDTGAYASLGDKVMTRATTHSCGPYRIPHTQSDCYAMYTNNPPAGAFRGFGVMQAAFTIESAMDDLASELGLDPIALRKHNALRAGDSTNTGQKLEQSVGLLKCLEAVEQRLHAVAGAEPFKPVREVVAGRELLTCWGVAAAFKNTGLGVGADDASGAIVTLKNQNRVQVKCGAAEVGQGMVSVLQLIAAEELGLDPTQINVYVMDTDLTPDGGATTASRQTFVSGNAVRLACQQLKDAATEALTGLGGILGGVQFEENGARAAGRHYSWHEIWELMAAREMPMSYEALYHAPRTDGLTEGGSIHFAFTFAAQAVKVGIDETTGEVRALHVISANDAGRVINPLGFQGQVEGGVVMGIGQALMEEFRVEDGVIWSDRMARNPIPRQKDTPLVENLVVEALMDLGPYGAKGVGEIVSIPTVPAITNAVFWATGFRATHLPLRAEDLKAWLFRSGE